MLCNSHLKALKKNTENTKKYRKYLNNKFNIEQIPTKIEIGKLIKTITEKPKELEIKTTNLIEKITKQVEIVTTEVIGLKRTIQQLEDKLLS